MPWPGWSGHSSPWQGQRAAPHQYASDFEDDTDDDFDDDFDDEFDYEGDDWDDEELDDFSRTLDAIAGDPDDDELTTRVNAALRRDGFLDSEAIQVSVDEGVITLRGEVSDYMQARYAWDDAWEVPGVRGVVSKLTVRGMERQEAPTNAARKASEQRKKS